MYCKHKYGTFSKKQIAQTKEYIRKKIYFLLLVAEDAEEKTKFPEVDLLAAHNNLMYRISGFNELLNRPKEIVLVLSLLEEAKNLIGKDFNFALYRKLILDAGAEVLKVKEESEV